MKTKMQVVEEIKMPTINRGIKRFIISKNGKGFFAHELGGKEQPAIAFNWQSCKAHRLNNNKRYGNKYGTFWLPMPYKTLQEARQRIISISFINIQYF